MGDFSKDIQSSFPNHKIKAVLNIKYTANWLKGKDNKFFKPYGISPQQYNILRILRGATKPIKVQEIKERMIEKSPNTTRLMDKLSDKGFIKRVRDKEDKRVFKIEISKIGNQLLSEIDTVTKYDFLDRLTEEEAIQLNDLLDKIR